MWQASNTVRLSLLPLYDGNGQNGVLCICKRSFLDKFGMAFTYLFHQSKHVNNLFWSYCRRTSSTSVDGSWPGSLLCRDSVKCTVFMTLNHLLMSKTNFESTVLLNTWAAKLTFITENVVISIYLRASLGHMLYTVPSQWSWYKLTIRIHEMHLLSLWRFRVLRWENELVKQFCVWSKWGGSEMTKTCRSSSAKGSSIL